MEKVTISMELGRDAFGMVAQLADTEIVVVCEIAVPRIKRSPFSTKRSGTQGDRPPESLILNIV